MNINAPTPALYPQLKNLWQQAFGDPMGFIDGFFQKGFSPERCRCVTLDGQVAAALYWFDSWYQGEKFAYIYAVATEKDHRGKGLCRNLMQDTHAHLSNLGYGGAVLVPAEAGLWDYYGTMGYHPFGNLESFSVAADAAPVALQALTAAEYIQKRRTYLPQEAPDETPAITYFGTWGQFYAGTDWVMAAATNEGQLYAQEFLGSSRNVAGIVTKLGCTQGHFRTPGGNAPCGMCLLFSAPTAPGYLGFPLD